MKKCSCDKCGEDDSIHMKYYEITYKQFPSELKIVFDLCANCYEEFRKVTREYYI